MISLEFRSDAEVNTFRQLLQPVWEDSGAGQAWLLHDAEGRSIKGPKGATQ
jgi:hypothetical protein